MLVFEERRYPEYPNEKFSEQGRAPTDQTQHTYIHAELFQLTLSESLHEKTQGKMVCLTNKFAKLRYGSRVPAVEKLGNLIKHRRS